MVRIKKKKKIVPLDTITGSSKKEIKKTIPFTMTHVRISLKKEIQDSYDEIYETMLNEIFKRPKEMEKTSHTHGWEDLTLK